MFYLGGPALIVKCGELVRLKACRQGIRLRKSSTWQIVSSTLIIRKEDDVVEVAQMIYLHDAAQ